MNEQELKAAALADADRRYFRRLKNKTGRWSGADLRALRAKKGLGPVRKIRRVS